jgi:MOSC domain-containing protein YiiM
MSSRADYLTIEQLEAGLETIRQAPRDEGSLVLLVRRPRDGEREVLGEGELDPHTGLAGDNWSTRGSKRTADGSAHPGMQLTIMNARVIALLARERERWPLAGDQLYVDLDLSSDNLPAGMRLALGAAIVEISPEPHTGCHKFAARFGPDALKFVSSPDGRQLNLRGVNARVVQPGTIRVGDVVRKLQRRGADPVASSGAA